LWEKKKTLRELLTQCKGRNALLGIFNALTRITQDEALTSLGEKEGPELEKGS